MQNDYITLKNLALELNDTLKDGFIDKILMPETDEIVIGVNKEYKHFNLLMSANASLPRIHLSTIKKSNPSKAFNFLMHLRKLCEKGSIKSISMLNNDRIFDINIASENELKDTKTYHIFFEYMGRFSNIFVVNENNQILNAIKPLSYNESSKRQLLIGDIYLPPREAKQSIENFASLYYNGNGTIAEYLNNTFQGGSKDLYFEIEKRVMLDDSKVDINQKIKNQIEIILNIYGTSDYIPSVSIENNVAKDYFITPYITKNVKYVKKPSLSSAIEDVLSSIDKGLRLKNKIETLNLTLNRKIAKLENAIKNNETTLNKNSDYDKYRIKGDLILSNIYKIEKKQDFIEVENYYDNMKIIKISLDPMLSPQENANLQYKRYNKLKRQVEHLTTLSYDIKKELDYLYVIKKDMELLNNEDDIDDIVKMLIDQHLIKDEKPKFKKGSNKKPIKKTKYIPNVEKHIIDGFNVYLGHNSIQNEYVTFDLGNSNDLWFHAKDYHGAHAIIKIINKEPDISTIEKVAILVAKSSECKNEIKATVDYTKRMNVKKSPSKQTGLVNYKNYKSIVVNIN